MCRMCVDRSNSVNAVRGWSLFFCRITISCRLCVTFDVISISVSKFKNKGECWRCSAGICKVEVKYDSFMYYLVPKINAHVCKFWLGLYIHIYLYDCKWAANTPLLRIRSKKVFADNIYVQCFAGTAH